MDLDFYLGLCHGTAKHSDAEDTRWNSLHALFGVRGGYCRELFS